MPPYPPQGARAPRLYAKGYISVPIGTGDVFGSRVTIVDARSLGYLQLILEAIFEIIGGTLASGETVTIRHICVFSDGTETYYDRSYTSTGNWAYTITYTEFSESMFRHPSKVPVALVVQAKTNMSTTSATVSVTGRGWLW